MTTRRPAGVSFHDLSAGGEAGALIRAKDWSATPLGPMSSWSRSLTNYLSMILELPSAAIIFWGPQQIQLYNDGYSVIMGPRHPRHLGSSFRECWPEAYDSIHPWMLRVLERGETVEVNRTLVPLARFGFTEESYFTFSFSPLRDDDGTITGVLQLVTEETDAVLGERRALVLHDLSARTAEAKTIENACRLSSHVFAKYRTDLPFTLIYVVDGRDEQRLVLSASTGLDGIAHPFPREIEVRAEAAAEIFELSRVVREGNAIALEGLALSIRDAPSPTAALASPIFGTDQKSVVGVFVSGLSPQLPFDERYRNFLELVCAQLATLIGAARAYEEERRRAEALAEVDRAKTEFFSNVSHEFRTPLTLILGPLEDALRDPWRTLRDDALEVVHRNALRLLKLVNTLLEFSRAQAKQQQSSFEPVDLAVFTAGLAGAFQSLIEGAGLRLVVDCPALPEAVYVDRSLWEKIVLNLVSNAFKFTFEGEVAVRLRWQGDRVVLEVSDTGTGIPAAELPRVFERFHRVEGARGRSFEGSGIGLALVQELVSLHGGTVNVASVEGEGTTFTVSIPTGTAHLPEDRIVSPSAPTSHRANVESYLQEATPWLSSTLEATRVSGVEHDSSTLILVADDNADMRQYLVRLLEPHWSVIAVSDGAAALALARQRNPDLILSDVMMPIMDGLTLLHELRGDAATSAIPFIMLSARAGQDAVLDGLETGADDYLVKPFAARELLSRVKTMLQMQRIRQEKAATAKELAETRATLIAELEARNRALEAAFNELQAAQAQLVQSAKMASLGELVAGVAHEINNPLAFAISHVGTVSRTLEQLEARSVVASTDATERADWERASSRLRELQGGLARIRELVVKLRTFSRLDEGELKPIDMRDSVEAVLTILRHRLGSEINTVVDIGEPAEVICYAGLLNQAVMNLVSNAIDAVEGKGTITISARADGAWFVISVEDDGRGIPDDIRDRVMEPFFTTKPVGQGTGLGLSITYSIVRKHEGELDLSARPGGGTVAKISLPLRR